MMNTWVVVADATRARFFATDNARGPLRELETMVHPEGRMHIQDLTSDLPGRASDGMGQGGRHGLDGGNGLRQHETQSFARSIATRLSAARRDGALHQLLIASAPALLGAVRAALDPDTARCVVFESDKNLAQLSPEDIRRHLPDPLPGRYVR